MLIMLRISNKVIVIAGCFVFLLSSCSLDGKIRKEVKEVDIEEVRIKRYEQALFTIDTLKIQEELEQLKNDFGPFLNADLSDPANISRIQDFISDTSVRNLYQITMDHYADLDFLEDELTLAFKHIMFYFPEWTAPEVYSYVSGLYYEVPVSYNGFELIIALDMYLGEDFKLYRKIGMPLYQIQQMTRERIVADCIEEIIRSVLISDPPPGNLLDKMLTEGKIMYLAHRFMPLVNHENKIGFTKEQMKWCRQNEANMWAYFIENDLLFTTDPILMNRFTNDGPFTAAFGKESPARASVWVGWQIIESYMDRDKSSSPADLIMKHNSMEILQASGYKPRRSGF
jgi:hypothetical protein